MYSYNVPIYYKNMHKTYTMMSLLWAAQQTERGLCFKEQIWKADEDIQVQAWHLEKWLQLFFSRSAIVGLLFVTIPSLGIHSGSIMQYHYDTQKKPNIILPGTWIHHTPQCSHLWEHYKELIS